jgi:hypothetical protein
VSVERARLTAGRKALGFGVGPPSVILRLGESPKRRCDPPDPWIEVPKKSIALGPQELLRNIEKYLNAALPLTDLL